MVRGLRGLREARRHPIRSLEATGALVRDSGRKFDEFLYGDPNDELAKARAAFGKK